jgi:hypothetical protein
MLGERAAHMASLQERMGDEYKTRQFEKTLAMLVRVQELRLAGSVAK